LVSVVIPVRDGEPYLADCLDSVLAQSYPNLEVVISESGSTDATAEILASYRDERLSVLASPPQALSVHENWSRAMTSAHGEFVKLVCQDDLLLPDCLAAQTRLFAEHPDAVLVCGRRRIIDDRGHTVIAARGLSGLVRHDETALRPAGRVAAACVRAGTNLLGEPAGVLLRRAALPEPLFDRRWTYTLDLALYMGCLAHGPAVVEGTVRSCFRVSPRQLSAVLARRQATELAEYLAVLCRAYPNETSRFDLALGVARATLLARARGLLYSALRFRGGRRGGERR
jgi:glycosyltransferase involved in cell wall biosynthesis